MSIVGDQLPIIPFCEVVGNGFKKSPAQIGNTGLNVGTTRTRDRESSRLLFTEKFIACAIPLIKKS